MTAYYLDEDFSPTIAVIARRHFGLDVTSAHDVGMRTSTDDEQLAFATAEDRCILTKNRGDFVRLDTEYRRANRTHGGILIVSRSLPPHDFAAVARALAYWHELQEGQSMRDRVDFLHPPPHTWQPRG